MIKITKDVPNGKRIVSKIFFSRREALQEAERLDRQGREPRIVRPLPGTQGWYVWYKAPMIGGLNT